MTDAAPAIFVALEASSLGAAIRQSTWLYMAANVGHILSLAVFAGGDRGDGSADGRHVRGDGAGPNPARYSGAWRSSVLPDCC